MRAPATRVVANMESSLEMPTATSVPMLCALSAATSSSSDRVECPMV
jgi:hypothetical protein